MALKAGYYGVKKKILDELRKLDGILPAGVSKDNKLVTEQDVEQNVQARVDWINAKGYVGRNILPYPIGTRQVISSTGEITDNSDMYLSDFVDVSDIKSLRISCTDTTGNIAVRVAKYDASKIFIERIITDPQPDTPVIVSLDTNVKYVRFCLEDSLSAYYTEPMVMDSNIPLTAYEPHALTNQELTASVADQKTAINAIITAATEAADFAAFKTAMGAITPVTRSLSIQEPETREASDPEPEQETKSTKRSTKKTETTE